MPNMSHCMFENTSNDLRECWNADGFGQPELLSEGEKKALRRTQVAANVRRYRENKKVKADKQ